MNTCLTRPRRGETCEPSALQNSPAMRKLSHPTSGQGAESRTVSRICRQGGRCSGGTFSNADRVIFSSIQISMLDQDVPPLQAAGYRGEPKIGRPLEVILYHYLRLNTGFVFQKFGVEIQCYTDDTQQSFQQISAPLFPLQPGSPQIPLNFQCHFFLSFLFCFINYLYSLMCVAFTYCFIVLIVKCP